VFYNKQELDEYLTDDQIIEFEEAEKLPDIRRFTKNIELVYNHSYDEFKMITKKIIEEVKWECLYCVWWLDLPINYHFK
jgi:hypothetical protein